MIRRICARVSTCRADTYTLMDQQPLKAAGMLAAVGAVLGVVVGVSIV